MPEVLVASPGNHGVRIVTLVKRLQDFSVLRDFFQRLYMKKTVTCDLRDAPNSN